MTTHTIEVRWTKTVEHKTIIELLDDGTPSYVDGDQSQSHFAIDEIIDPDGDAPDFDRDEIVDFLIEED